MSLNVAEEEATTNTTPTSQPDEDPSVEAGRSTAASEAVSLVEIIDETTSAPVVTSMLSPNGSEVETSDDGNIFGGNNSSGDSFVTPVELDSGSGIPTSEQDEKNPPKSVDGPNNTQMPTKSE